jgi:mannan polymerase II complex MNN10 subunit
MSALRDLTFANKQEYCDRHGYTFVGETDIFHEKDEKGNQKPDRPASWSKIPLILKLMPEFDFVFWTDADSVITNMDFKLEDVIADAERGDYNFIVSNDQNGKNCGQMIFKKTLATWNFLRDAWAKEDHIHSGVWEQGAIGELLRENPERVRELVVPQRLFNSYPSIWRRGDFLIHVPRDDRWKDRIGTLLKALSGEVDHFDVGPP